jgi:hypothetical protein
MKQEYDFSKGERGKFCNAEAQLEIPVYLEPDVAAFLNRDASQTSTEVEALVNDWIRKDIALIETIMPSRRDTGRDSSRV